MGKHLMLTQNLSKLNGNGLILHFTHLNPLNTESADFF